MSLLIWFLGFGWAEQNSIKAMPRIVRSSPVTEVFFYDHGQSYIIPEHGNYNQIMNAILTAQKKRVAVELIVDEKKRTVVGVGQSAGGSSAVSTDEVKSIETKAKSEPEGSPTQKEEDLFYEVEKPKSKSETEAKNKKPTWEDL